MTDRWDTGICGSCCTGTCCCALFLPCVVYGQNVELMEKRGISPVPIVDDIHRPDYCSKSCWGSSMYSIGFVGSLVAGSGAVNPTFGWMGLLWIWSVFMECTMRNKLRTVYNIPYDWWVDACLGLTWSCCCYSCFLSQENRHLRQTNVPTQTTIPVDMAVNSMGYS